MIKRPLIWLFGAYLCGLFLVWNRIPHSVLILVMLIYLLILYLLLYRIKVRYINRKDGFLWSLPLLLVLGFLTMGQRLSPPGGDAAFAEGADGTLTGDITMIAEKASGTAIYTRNNLITFTGGETYPAEHIIIYTSDSAPYLVGNKIQVSGRILKFSEPSNPGQFNERMYYKIQNIDYKMKAVEINITDHNYSRLHTFLGKLRQKLHSVYAGILPEREAGVMTAMLLGENYLLEEELRQLYQDNGIAHILAISGLHITLIGYTLYQLLRKCKAGLIPSVTISILFIYCYGLMTNFSVSTNRAIVMFVVMLLSKIAGKTYDSISALALCAFLILLNNPLQLFSTGFLLSFGAVFGISVLLPAFRKLFPLKSTVLFGVLASISALLITLPLILWFFYQLPVYSVIINLLILPTMTVLMLSAIAAGVAGLFSMPLGVFLIGGAKGILGFIEGICRLGSSLPGNLYTIGKPDRIRVLIYIMVLICFLWAAGRYQRKRLLLLPVLALIILLLPERDHGLSVTMLDVGQGDAIILKNETGTTYLIDGGSSDVYQVGKNRLQPYLLYTGEDCIDYAIVTHADEDHINGLKELIEGRRIRIRHLVLPGVEIRSRSADTIEYSPEDDRIQHGIQQVAAIPMDKLAAEEAYLDLEQLALSSGIKVLYINSGDEILDGDLRIECLHPEEEYEFSSSNSYSTVLSITFGEFDLLLTGDLERDGEKLVMQKLLMKCVVSGDKNLTDYDVLKVAHHGSRNSTYEDFLALIRPEYSLISCSEDNWYGHPHVELIERLIQIGSEMYITKDNGAVTIVTDGRTVTIGRVTNKYYSNNAKIHRGM